MPMEVREFWTSAKEIGGKEGSRGGTTSFGKAETPLARLIDDERSRPVEVDSQCIVHTDACIPEGELAQSSYSAPSEDFAWSINFFIRSYTCTHEYASMCRNSQTNGEHNGLAGGYSQNPWGDAFVEGLGTFVAKHLGCDFVQSRGRSLPRFFGRFLYTAARLLAPTKRGGK